MRIMSASTTCSAFAFESMVDKAARILQEQKALLSKAGFAVENHDSASTSASPSSPSASPSSKVRRCKLALSRLSTDTISLNPSAANPPSCVRRIACACLPARRRPHLDRDDADHRSFARMITCSDGSEFVVCVYEV